MTFKEFLERPHTVNKLLTSLGILLSKQTIIKINTNPDYNISDYRREDESDYYFKNHWDFSAAKYQ